MKIYMIVLSVIILGVAFVVATTYADQEVVNGPYVRACDYGIIYARAVPADGDDREAGTTRIYRVREQEDQKDELWTTYNWYAQDMVIAWTGKGVCVIRFGPWPRGHKATADQLAVAFYLEGKLLKSYSTLDIAGKADNVETSKSHYTVIKKHSTTRGPVDNRFTLNVETVDGRIISFDPTTGETISTITTPSAK